MTSGDGKTPETAFVIGGRVPAEYQVLGILGLRPQMQAFTTIRGCSFDVLTARDPDSGEARPVYFKLGPDTLSSAGPCALEPAIPDQRSPQGIH